jgi:ribosomal protein L7/L12
MRKKPEIPFLAMLEKLYEQERLKIKPLYPYNKKTGEIRLPEEIVIELKFLLVAGNKPAAIKRVAELTGAGLRMSKDYVDALLLGYSKE